MGKLYDFNGLLLTARPESERKPAGIWMADGQVIADTWRCVHCQKHVVSIKGSKTERGWCAKCNGPFCGRQCAECYPWEKKLDDYEKGKLITL